MKQKANILIELYASDVTNGLDHGHDHGHDHDFAFSKSNMEFAISQPKMSDCHEMKSKHINWALGLNMTN